MIILAGMTAAAAMTAFQEQSSWSTLQVPGYVVLGLMLATALLVFGLGKWGNMSVGRRSPGSEIDQTRRQAHLGIGKFGSDREQNEKDLAGALKLQREKTEVLRGRSRALEQILAVSVRFNATRDLPELMEKIVSAVAEIIGFRKVILHLWSDQTHAFEARACAGVDELDKALFINKQISSAEFSEFTDVKYRYSNCYLVNADQDFSGQKLRRQENERLAQGPAQEWQSNQVLIAPLINSGGEVRGYLGLDEPQESRVPGIIEIRLLEFLIQQITTALESAEAFEHLARNNEELALASEKLASLTDMKANFIANVSHELRTPLTSISAYTELLQSNIDSMSEEARREFLKVINQESVKLSGIINDILELNSMENRKPELPQATTDMVTLVRHLGASWKLRAAERNIDFTLRVSSEEIQLQVDGLLIQQLLGHLLGNAFKFTPEGGRVTMKLEETGTAVRLILEDSGIGIPEDELGEIFNQFYQVDASATREHNGQGVGLAICHEIVSHYDGRIWAENVKPSGARFVVLLPRRPAVVQPADRLVTTGFPFEPGEFMQRLMHWISESLGVQLVTLMVPDEEKEYLTIRAAIGLPEAVVQSCRVRRGTGYVGKVWARGKTLLVENVISDEGPLQEVNEPRYSTPSLLCVPLHHGSNCVGVITVNNRIDDRSLDQDDRLFLESLAPRISELLVRFTSWQQEAQNFVAVRETLRATTSVGHLRQESLLDLCQEICLASARRLQLPEDEIIHLAFALQFYDVGLSRVPPPLINKPDFLDEHEELFVQKHVQASLAILDSLNPDSKVRQIILHHHENFDGSGYPAGLDGESIPMGSRLLRLADTLSALLRPRTWRLSFSLDEAVKKIREGSGQIFCPHVSVVFLAETENRRERLEFLQRQGDDGVLLDQPTLDREGMMSLK